MTNPLLILDLDETVIYGTRTPPSRPADLVLEDFHIYQRPYLAAFLATVRPRYRLAVWTAATSSCAEPIVAKLFPNDLSLEAIS